MFFSPAIGLILFVTHILSCLTVGFLFRWWGKSKEKKYRNSDYTIEDSALSFCNLGEVLSKSIISSINTVLMIGGFVVLFSIIISILRTSHILSAFVNLLSIVGVPDFLSMGLISGFIEVTNGVSFISSLTSCDIHFQLILASSILGFGGFSVLLQVLSITSKSNISIKPYLYGNLVQACFAGLYTYLII